jgi:terminase small subunit / prophage DNA-packing protein
MTDSLSLQIDQAAFARLVGISRQAVGKLVKSGTLPAGGTLAVWVLAYVESLRARSSRQTAGLSSERERLARERADNLALQNAALRGELVNADAVRRAVTTLAATVRAGFERVPDKLSERLAVLSDPTACHALLAVEIDQVLADLAAGARQLKVRDGGINE